MPKTYEIRKEDAKEIREKMKKCKNKNVYRRMEAVALRGEGKSNEEIANITKYNSDWVSKLVSLFCRKGIEELAKDNRGGDNHRNLSKEQEEEILGEFLKCAKAGQVITATEIKKKYDEVLGRETKPTFIYEVLKRNNWRMVMPRAKHPKKASDKDIEVAKKLT